MNRHFDDARYHLKRFWKNAVRGLRTELEPAEEWARAKTGREMETEPRRMENVRSELRELPEKVERGARETIDEARGRFRSYRGRTN